MEMKIVNETQADLGLTAIPSSSVLDIMCQVPYLQLFPVSDPDIKFGDWFK
jgi:hypothetical protein